MSKNQGLLIVLEGIDGSGKTTQIKLLSQELKTKKIPFEIISFPQYGKNKFAKEIFDYLSGKFGKLAEVDPHTTAKLYAADRKTARDKIKNWLANGKLVIANRYVSSSKAHLGANLLEDKRDNFIKWIDRLEYKTNQMPKEDLTVLLNVDPKVGQQNSQTKNHPDIHEDNLKHLHEANKIYLELAKSAQNWCVVSCTEDGNMRGKQDIHLLVSQQVAHTVNLKA